MYFWYKIIFSNYLYFSYKPNCKNSVTMRCALDFNVFTSVFGLPSRLGLLNTTTAPLQRGKTLPNACLGYHSKLSDGEVPVMLELWGMQSTLSLPLLPDPLWPRVGAPDRVISLGQIELNCVLMLNWITWNRTAFTSKLLTFWHLTMCKQNLYLY